MATRGHCAYCFEILSADLENRKPLSYRQVQDLWEQYQLLGKARAGGRETSYSVETDGVDDEDSMVEDEEEEEEDENDEDDDEEKEENISAGIQEQASKPPQLQLPSISRLQVPSPSTPSSASSTSTPSSLSTTSSQAALGGGHNSKSSSNSSFFSFTRSKQPSPVVPPTPKEEQYPLFVTWNTISPRSGHKSLRGCIGTFDPHELPAGLKSYALTAAYDDTRFPPITHSELPSLSCSTTLLTSFTPCAHPLDWTLGTHGIRISFTHHNKRYGATYLPDVAVEQGWTKEETLASLMRKAGVGRGVGWREVRGGVDVVRYEGKKATLGWGQWRAWRGWVAREGLGGR